MRKGRLQKQESEQSPGVVQKDMYLCSWVFLLCMGEGEGWRCSCTTYKSLKKQGIEMCCIR